MSKHVIFICHAFLLLYRCDPWNKAETRARKKSSMAVGGGRHRAAVRRQTLFSKLTCQRHVICYIANVLQHVKSKLNRFDKPVLAVLLIGLLLLLNAMAASPALHELIHKDADSASHSCAATLFAHGHVESAACDVPVFLPATFVETSPHFEFFVFSTAIKNLPPGRAPPAVASPLV